MISEAGHYDQRGGALCRPRLCSHASSCATPTKWDSADLVQSREL
jgi:hypothetical protein